MTNHDITDGGRECEQSEHGQRFMYEIDDDELPSEAVIRAVAAVTNTSVIELDPLYDVVDPNHLDGTLEETDSSVQTEMSFQFNSCEVTVTPGEVQVCEAEADD